MQIPSRSERAIRHRTVRSGSVALHCAYAGDAEDSDAPLVILLHGFPSGWSVWRAQLVGLAEAGFLAVAPDLRGAGRSDKPPEVADYRSERFVEDVLAVAAAFGRERFALVGHDMGGLVAWATAMQRPERVMRLAILNSVHPAGYARQMRHLSQLRRSWYVLLFQLPRIPEWIVRQRDFALLEKALLGDGLPPETAHELVAAVKAPGALSATINWYRASVRAGVLGSAPRARVSVPSLVIWGDRERYLDSALAEPPRDLVSHCRVVHLPTAGHWVQLDEPARVTGLLVEHLRGEG
jgi:pimeloyl-ACP methyl ester carboxylesterase